jgi:hypothetical protein
MQEHLSNEQLTEYLTDPLASGGDASIREHLAACAACRNEAGRLHSLLALYGEVTRAAGARPQAFWQWQRTTILTGLEPSPVPRRLVWAAGVAMAALAATLLMETPPPAVPPAVDPDHALLVDVERSVRREVPRALEPAALLTAELSQAADTTTKQQRTGKGERR